VSVEGLHRFYASRMGQAPNAQEIVASWMTRRQRELMIADNVTYVNGVLGAIAEEFGEPPATIHVGFSQGASMAYRAAALGRQPAAAVVALGGDVPPDLEDSRLALIPAVLIGWGVRDRFYDAAKREADEQRLRAVGVRVMVIELDAGHAWTAAFTADAARWISAFR
jgi:predicted esterase